MDSRENERWGMYLEVKVERWRVAKGVRSRGIC